MLLTDNARYHAKVMKRPQTIADNSPVQSEQTQPHSDLLAVVAKHIQYPWQKPIPEHTRQAGEAALEWLNSRDCSNIVLDSFCGTGLSSSLLAQRHPDACVIGLDKSADRLSRHCPNGINYRLFRAECEPFWRFLLERGVKISHHYMLYPNPWPKSGQLKRRIHGHPAFPLLKRLGGEVEVRSNWKIYVDEFADAWAALSQPGVVSQLTIDAPISLFERKYHDRGQTLWQFRSSA